MSEGVFSYDVASLSYLDWYLWGEHICCVFSLF